MKKVVYSLSILALVLLTSCGWIGGAGRSVEGVAEGAGHALSETGDAIGDAAQETENTIEEAV